MTMERDIHREINALLSYPIPSLEETQIFAADIRNNIRNRYDHFRTLASQLTIFRHVASLGDIYRGAVGSPGESTQSTHLLDILYSNINSNLLNPVAASVLLHLQSSLLPPQSALVFIVISTSILKKLIFLNPVFIKLLHREVGTVCYLVANMSCKINRSKSVIATLREVASIVSPRSGCLTGIHADLLQVCIKSQQYGIALDFIREQDIIEVDPETAEVTIEDVLRYFYYSGICFIAIKDFASALHAFNTVICAPAEVVSKIMEESIKKCKLISLIYNSSVYEVPRNASTAIVRMSRDPMSAYDDIVKCFSDSKIHSLEEVIVKVKDSLERDNNYGIALQVVDAWRKNKLRLLSESFVNLQMTEIGQAISISDVNEVENFILREAKAKNIIAIINHEDGVVNFPEKSMATQSLSDIDLHESMQDLTVLNDKIQEAQRECLTSKRYLMKITSVSGGRGPGGLASASS